MEQGLFAITRGPGMAGLLPVAERNPSASGLNFSCQISRPTVRYLDGNACTEYEDESDV